jgi:hypothetical protein
MRSIIVILISILMFGCGGYIIAEEPQPALEEGRLSEDDILGEWCLLYHPENCINVIAADVFYLTTSDVYIIDCRIDGNSFSLTMIIDDEKTVIEQGGKIITLKSREYPR